MITDRRRGKKGRLAAGGRRLAQEIRAWFNFVPALARAINGPTFRPVPVPAPIGNGYGNGNEYG